MKKIDFLVPMQSQYAVLNHFTYKLMEALENDIECRLIEMNEEGIRKICTGNPDCTFSFNGIVPDQGKFFFEMTRIPHVSYLVDAPHNYLELCHNPYSIIISIDRTYVQLLKDFGCPNVLFMPHAVESSLSYDPLMKRDFEVVLLATAIDYVSISDSWKSKYPKALCNAMQSAAEDALTNIHRTYYDFLIEELNREKNVIDLAEIDLASVLSELELYIRGKERMELIKSIETAKVDLFGSAEVDCWHKYLGNKKNVRIHSSVSFDDALEIMKRSKIVLNSAPTIIEGAHERIFSSLACGALPIVNKNHFLQRRFHSGRSLLYFRYGEWKKMNMLIDNVLQNESLRSAIVDKGREIVMKLHTWDERVKQILRKLPPLLSKIRRI